MLECVKMAVNGTSHMMFRLLIKCAESLHIIYLQSYLVQILK